MTNHRIDGKRASSTGSTGIVFAIALMALAAFTAGPLTGTAGAHAGTDVFTIEPRESDCPSGDFCFVATEGDPANISAGDQVRIFLENPSSNEIPHNLHVALLDEADSDNQDTSESAAFASTEDIQPGEETELTFQVPSGSSGVYLWCDIGAHEARGMFLELQFSDQGGDGGQNGSPFPTMPTILALAGLALVLRRR